MKHYVLQVINSFPTCRLPQGSRELKLVIVGMIRKGDFGRLPQGSRELKHTYGGIIEEMFDGRLPQGSRELKQNLTVSVVMFVPVGSRKGAVS